MYSFLLLVVLTNVQAFLQVDKQKHIFTWNGQKTFLNGVNQAWIQYGNDFGNDQSNAEYCALRSTLRNITAVGGHAIRIWLFVEGDSIPQFDGSGNVIGTDSKHTLIRDMKKYLQTAQNEGVLVFFCLWNAAVLRNNNVKNLISDPNKLRTFIDKVLTPMAKELSGELALGGWEIMNEPEGSVAIASDSEPCFSTSNLKGTGAGWTGDNLKMQDLLRFFNLQSSAIHAADPKALVTVGAWSEHSITDRFGMRNYYKDECLVKAGGKSDGILNFYQIHSYAGNNGFGENAPFKKSKADYGLDKPLVVGEFSQGSSAGLSAPQLYTYVYDHGYDGAWGWTAEAKYNNYAGMAALRGKPDVQINVPKGPIVPDSCSCSDVAPPGGFSCEQQASWGKCGETWMKGFCCKSCFACVGCKANPRRVF